MIIYYLASPYTHPDPVVREARYKEVCKAMTRILTKFGFGLYCPIVQTHPLASNCGLRPDFGFWENFDKSILARLDGIIVVEMEGWLTSVGVKAEMEFAQGLGFPIKYYNPETETISTWPTRNIQKTHLETTSRSDGLSESTLKNPSSSDA